MGGLENWAIFMDVICVSFLTTHVGSCRSFIFPCFNSKLGQAADMNQTIVAKFPSNHHMDEVEKSCGINWNF